MNMKNGIGLLILLFVFFLCIFTLNNCGSDSTAVQPVTAPTSVATFTVKGVITNSQAQPAGGVNCTLEVYGPGIAGAVINTTQTDPNGYYSFSNISGGRYKLVASKEGYVKVNSIFHAAKSQLYSTVNILMVRNDEWNSVMGADHPYDANTGYVMVSAMDSVVTEGDLGRDSEMTAQFAPLAAVSVQLVSNKDGAPVVYQTRGYLNDNGAVDWNAQSTYKNGIACFYGVKTGETCTLSATSASYYFDTETDAVAVAGEMNHYILIGTKGGIGGGGYPPAIQRVADMSPIKGICYKPSPHDYKGDGQGLYYDSDFCNDDFDKLWGPAGRDDIGKFSAAGVNFLHIYDMNQPGAGRKHTNFMNYCNQKGIYIAYPVSAWYVVNGSDATWFTNFVNEVYPGKTRHPAVLMWCIGNEFDLGGMGQTADLIAKTAVKIIKAEDDAGIPDSERIAITSPVSFAVQGGGTPGISQIKALKDAFTSNGLSDVFQKRFIASVNPFNPGSDLGPYVSSTVPTETARFNNGESLPFCFFEMGKEIGNDVTNEQQQADFYKGQLEAVFPLANNYGPFFGACIFETVNEGYKGGTEATFGVYRISVPDTNNTGGNYPVDTWVEKPNFASMKQYY